MTKVATLTPTTTVNDTTPFFSFQSEILFQSSSQLEGVEYRRLDKTVKPCYSNSQAPYSVSGNRAHFREGSAPFLLG